MPEYTHGGFGGHLNDNRGSELDAMFGLGAPLEHSDWVNKALQNKEESSDDFTKLVSELKDAIRGAFDENWRMWEDQKTYNAEQASQSFERQKQLIEYEAQISKNLRSSQFQDTVQDLVKAGINPAVYFGNGGNVGNTSNFSAGNVGVASVGAPNSDKVSSLANAVSNIMTAIANNKNADSAVLRSILGIFSGNFNLSKLALSKD